MTQLQERNLNSSFPSYAQMLIMLIYLKDKLINKLKDM